MPSASGRISLNRVSEMQSREYQKYTVGFVENIGLEPGVKK